MGDIPLSNKHSQPQWERAIASPSEGTMVVVVGIDFSPMSAHLLRTARDLVRAASRAELHIVHVVPVQILASGLMDAIPHPGPVLEDSIERALKMLETLTAPIEQVMSGIVIPHVRVGNPANEIPRLAFEVAADLIVVEAHGRTGLRRMLHRSVAAQLARNAPCSVLTVRDKHGQARVAPLFGGPRDPHDEASAVALDY
jgi:universal stress protein A